jgi:hypothetical protein
LDDPLSAVDAEVGSQIFKQCINGYLQDKTRIWVTNQFQYLKYADVIVVLENGSIVAQGIKFFIKKSGSYNDILNKGGKWEKYLSKDVVIDKQEEKKQEESLIDNLASSSIFEEEERSTGFVSWSVIYTYFKNMNLFLVFFCLCYFIHSQLGLISSGTLNFKDLRFLDCSMVCRVFWWIRYNKQCNSLCNCKFWNIFCIIYKRSCI